MEFSLTSTLHFHPHLLFLLLLNQFYVNLLFTLKFVLATCRSNGPEGWRLRQRHFETVTSLIQSCRRFFPPGSALEIWSEFKWVSEESKLTFSSSLNSLMMWNTTVASLLMILRSCHSVSLFSIIKKYARVIYC